MMAIANLPSLESSIFRYNGVDEGQLAMGITAAAVSVLTHSRRAENAGRVGEEAKSRGRAGTLFAQSWHEARSALNCEGKCVLC